MSSVDDGDGLDLDDPLRDCERGHTDEGARWRRPIREEGRSRVPDDGSVFRLIVYDLRGDLHDVGIARAGGGKRQSDIAHRLRCLRGQVSRTDQRTASINGHLASRVDGTPA